MKVSIVFLLLIISFVACWNDDGGYQDSLDNQSKMGIITLIRVELSPKPKYCGSGELESINDNGDGTIQLILKSKGSNFDGTCHTSILYKKCVQGQIYRKTENDCKGGGDESNNYNAKLFTGESNSQEYKTCSSDNFNGKSWDIAIFSGTRFDKLSELLLKENSFLNQQCLLYEAYYDGTVKCTLLPNNEVMIVKKEIYKLYTICDLFLNIVYKNNNGEKL